MKKFRGLAFVRIAAVTVALSALAASVAAQAARMLVGGLFEIVEIYDAILLKPRSSGWTKAASSN